ncbi:MAG: class I SAM-dependent methyltransferase, partial [Clostridiales bacterium]|nr:class I SAM-dependent methyltransferase [Clostridiales bacterium]
MFGSLAGVYDRFMYDADYDKWFAGVLGLIKSVCPTAREGLDAACGSGTFTLKLADAGYRMTGSDISEEMLSEALQKGKGRAGFIRQDLNDIRLNRPVDFITILCDGVNYVTEGLSFRSAYDALNPGGVLIFDISSEYKLSEIIGNNTFSDDCG